MNREERRLADRLRRRDGCTCHAPKMDDLPVRTTMGERIPGVLIHHAIGCPMGDAAEPWNKLGILPGFPRERGYQR